MNLNNMRYKFAKRHFSQQWIRSAGAFYFEILLSSLFTNFLLLLTSIHVGTKIEKFGAISIIINKATML